MTRVAVVIPARNSARTLADAVGSALDQTGVDVGEVVLAVARSSDTTHRVAMALARMDPRVTVIDNPEGTTPAGLNRAIAAARADIIVRCDAHAVLPPGYVATAVSALDEFGAGNVGGRQVPTAENGFAVAVAAAMASPLGSGGAVYRSGTDPRTVETVYLGVFRREALEAVGGFDERLVRNQDYELNHRLRQAGWAVWFDPRLAVVYRPRDSVRGLSRQYRDYGRFKRLVMREHPSSIRARQLAPLGMVAGVVGSVVAGAVASTAWVPAVVVGGYVGLLVVGGLLADRRRPVQVAVALATMHWSWAIGFLEGPHAARSKS